MFGRREEKWEAKMNSQGNIGRTPADTPSQPTFKYALQLDRATQYLGRYVFPRLHWR